MEFNVLGPVEVMGESGRVALGGVKPRTLLAVLVAYLGRWVSIDRLVDEVWGEDPPVSAINTLQSYLSRLRRGLGADRLVSGPAGYKLVGEGAVCDAFEFERLVEEAIGERDPAARRRLLVEGLSLWRGSPYEDVADTPTIIAERIRLGERWLVGVERRVVADLDLGEHQRLVSELERLVDQHPMRESLWAHLMLACYRSGRQADALAAYRRLRNLLAEGLGIEPGTEIRRLEEQILLQDKSLDLGGPDPNDLGSRRALGTVTFLFTDIEGSTRLWEEHPQDMAVALAEHDRILRSAIKAADGYLFSSAGDSQAAAFQQASQAVRAAIDGQRFLQGLVVGGLPLPVRMAIHTGEVLERGGDYFGPVLNRAGRLRDAAHGGQILLSHAVEELVSAGLPDPVSLLNLGEHRLRDLTLPERIYQVSHPDLPSTFPPLHTLDATRHNLPIQLTSFVGREQEIAEIQKLLRGSRLVTLTGPGGCGKTRLGLQVAAEMVNEYPDGIWFVDLAPLTDPTLVASETAHSIGVKVGLERQSLFEAITAHLRQRRMLVILDNCEHLVEAAAALAAHLVRHTELVTVLATSRELLAVAGETTYPVPPLSTPDLATSPSLVASFPAVRLFAERGQAVRPGFEVTDANAATVAQVCSQLDGLPLALELAAARLRLLTPAELSARLGDRLRLLGGGPRHLPPRQSTLRATVDWSYDLLDPSERVLLRRLAVFARGFDLEAAEEACGFEPLSPSDVFDLLARLVDKSLVVVVQEETGTRYRLLETIRIYAGERLGEVAEEESEVRRRHAVFFTDLATESFDQLWGEKEIDWLERLEAEHDNLRLALAWCLDSGESQRGMLAAGSLYRFWNRHQHDEEGFRWLNRMLDADETPTIARARALLGAGTLASADQHAALLLDEAIELFEQNAPTSSDLSAARNNRAVVAVQQEDWATAIYMHEANLERSRQQGDSMQVTVSANGLVELVVEINGELERGLALAEEELGTARLTGSLTLLAGAWSQLGWVRTLTGDLEGAASALHKAREIEDRIGEDHLRWPGHSLRWLGVVAFVEGDLNKATDYVGKAIKQIRRHEHVDPRRHPIRHCLQTLACIEAARPRSVEAAVLLGAEEKARLNSTIGLYNSAVIEETSSTTLHALGPDAFHRAFAEGFAMTFDEAIDYALKAIDTSQNSPDHRSE